MAQVKDRPFSPIREEYIQTRLEKGLETGTLTREDLDLLAGLCSSAYGSG